MKKLTINIFKVAFFCSFFFFSNGLILALLISVVFFPAVWLMELLEGVLRQIEEQQKINA